MTKPSLTPMQDAARTMINAMVGRRGAAMSAPGAAGIASRISCEVVSLAILTYSRELDEGGRGGDIMRAFSNAFGEAVGSLVCSAASHHYDDEALNGFAAQMLNDAYTSACGVIARRNEIAAAGGRVEVRAIKAAGDRQ